MDHLLSPVRRLLGRLVAVPVALFSRRSSTNPLHKLNLDTFLQCVENNNGSWAQVSFMHPMHKVKGISREEAQRRDRHVVFQVDPYARLPSIRRVGSDANWANFSTAVWDSISIVLNAYTVPKGFAHLRLLQRHKGFLFSNQMAAPAKLVLSI